MNHRQIFSCLFTCCLLYSCGKPRPETRNGFLEVEKKEVRPAPSEENSVAVEEEPTPEEVTEVPPSQLYLVSQKVLSSHGLAGLDVDLILDTIQHSEFPDTQTGAVEVSKIISSSELFAQLEEPTKEKVVTDLIKGLGVVVTRAEPDVAEAEIEVELLIAITEGMGWFQPPEFLLHVISGYNGKLLAASNDALTRLFRAAVKSAREAFSISSFLKRIGIKIESVGPKVREISLDQSFSGSKDQFLFLVEFSEPVTGVELEDFSVNCSRGLDGCSLISVEGNGSFYQVLADSGQSAKNGTLAITLVDNDSIVNSSLVPLVGFLRANGTRKSEAVKIFRKPLRVEGFSLRGSNPTAAKSVIVRVEFSEKVSGFQRSNFSVSSETLDAVSVTEVMTDGKFVDVVIDTGRGEGEIQLEIVEAQKIFDLATAKRFLSDGSSDRFVMPETIQVINEFVENYSGGAHTLPWKLTQSTFGIRSFERELRPVVFGGEEAEVLEVRMTSEGDDFSDSFFQSRYGATPKDGHGNRMGAWPWHIELVELRECAEDVQVSMTFNYDSTENRALAALLLNYEVVEFPDNRLLTGYQLLYNGGASWQTLSRFRQAGEHAFSFADRWPGSTFGAERFENPVAEGPYKGWNYSTGTQPSSDDVLKGDGRPLSVVARITHDTDKAETLIRWEARAADGTDLVDGWDHSVVLSGNDAIPPGGSFGFAIPMFRYQQDDGSSTTFQVKEFRVQCRGLE